MKTSSSKLLSHAVATFLICIAGLTLAPAAAQAQPAGGGPFAPTPGPNGFGAPGELVFTVPVLRFGQNNGPLFEIAKVSGGETTISIQPALDYVIISNVTVGGIVGLSTSSGRGAVTVISLGARGGYDFSLGEKFS